MESKFSPEKELPEPQYLVHEAQAACFNEPNYARTSTLQVQTVPPQPQSIAIQPVALQPQHSVSITSPSASPAPPYDQWIFSQNIVHPPLQAVHAGYDIDQKLMYVARVYHNGEYIPAKAFPTHRKAYYPHQGQEIDTTNFEYLVGDKYIWVPGQPFPTGAVFVNPLSLNERSYVGRCNYEGSLLCGKFLPSQNCLYVPFGNREVIITENYEILVHVDRRQ